MPLYDCVLLLKPHIQHEGLIELATRIGKHVYRRNGVVTNIKSFGNVHLGYGIKKIGQERYFKGQLMQMTMMATPNMNKELHYLNKEDKLLRWLLVKHRDVKFGGEIDEDDYDSSNSLSPSSLFAEVADFSDEDVDDSSDYPEEE